MLDYGEICYIKNYNRILYDCKDDGIYLFIEIEKIRNCF